MTRLLFSVWRNGSRYNKNSCVFHVRVIILQFSLSCENSSEKTHLNRTHLNTVLCTHTSKVELFWRCLLCAAWLFFAYKKCFWLNRDSLPCQGSSKIIFNPANGITRRIPRSTSHSGTATSTTWLFNKFGKHSIRSSIGSKALTTSKTPKKCTFSLPNTPTRFLSFPRSTSIPPPKVSFLFVFLFCLIRKATTAFRKIIWLLIRRQIHANDCLFWFWCNFWNNELFLKILLEFG